MTPGTDGSGPHVPPPTTPDPVSRPVPPEVSTRKASWALGLALVPTPVTAAVAFGLGISVLNAGRDGRDHGRGRAIAAILLACCWGFVTLVAVTVALSLVTDTDTDSGIVAGSETVAEPTPSDGRVFFADLDEGDCIVDESFTEERALKATLGPCDEPHVAEVYAEFDLEEGSFPGDDVASRLADEGCTSRIEDLTGTPLAETPYETYLFYPTEWGWDDDRSVSCLALLPEPQRGTLEDLAAEQS